MSKKQEYLVKKYNESYCNYGNCFYHTYDNAWANTRKRDIMYVCKLNSVYFDGNHGGWTVRQCDIIRIVRRVPSTVY